MILNKFINESTLDPFIRCDYYHRFVYGTSLHLPVSTRTLTVYADHNDLTTLHGMPMLCSPRHGWLPHHTNIYCDTNNLTTLEGSPILVCGGYHCYTNKLSNLIGAPLYISGRFSVTGNPLTSLEGLPLYIGGDFLFSCLPGSPLDIPVRDVMNIIKEMGTRIGGNTFMYQYG